MKDIIRVGMFIAVEEPNGKTAKLLGAVLKKYEPQITKIVNAATEAIVKGIEEDKSETEPYGFKSTWTPSQDKETSETEPCED